MNAYRAGHVYLSAQLNSKTSTQIWVKFGMDIMPLGTTLKPYFSISTIGNTNMADEQTCEVGSTLAPLAMGPYSDVWIEIFRKYKTSV
jgi:hypothetical protein